MSWWRRRLSRRRLYAELSEEIRQHLEEKVEALLAAGLGRGEAERRARREFGNVALIEERSREVWRWPWLEALGADFRFGLRQCRNVALVLLAACVNVAALLLARSVKRGDEMALRVSLGAGHRRLAQQLVVEGFLLVAIAAVLGVLAAWLGLRLLGSVPGGELPRLAGVHLSAAALSATGAVAAFATLFFGWVPALTFSDLDLATALRRGRMQAERSHRRAFSSLVIAEVAASVVLAVGAGLLLRSFWRVQHLDPGFQPDSMLTVYLRTNYYGPEGRAFWQGVLNGVAALPEVRAAALADCTPGKGAAPATLVFDDRVNDPRQPPAAQGCWISAGFFAPAGRACWAAGPSTSATASTRRRWSSSMRRRRAATGWAGTPSAGG